MHVPMGTATLDDTIVKQLTPTHGWVECPRIDVDREPRWLVLGDWSGSEFRLPDPDVEHVLSEVSVIRCRHYNVVVSSSQYYTHATGSPRYAVLWCLQEPVEFRITRRGSVRQHKRGHVILPRRDQRVKL